MIKNLLLTLLFSAATLSAMPMHATASAANAPAIVPAPLTARFDGTEAMLPREVTVSVDDAALNQSYLLSVLEECGFEPHIVSGRRADIRFVTDKGLARENNERYVLHLDDRGITASAGTTAGLLNALQTLRQVSFSAPVKSNSGAPFSGLNPVKRNAQKLDTAYPSL